jgi:hypothetical protein
LLPFSVFLSGEAKWKKVDSVCCQLLRNREGQQVRGSQEVKVSLTAVFSFLVLKQGHCQTFARRAHKKCRAEIEFSYDNTRNKRIP